MRIPVGEKEIGYFYPIGKSFYFCQDSFDYCYPRGKGYRKGTFSEFKKLYPITNSRNGSNVRLRVKSKSDRW